MRAYPSDKVLSVTTDPYTFWYDPPFCFRNYMFLSIRFLRRDLSTPAIDRLVAYLHESMRDNGVRTIYSIL